uniref:AlNc14C2033G13131 protein n=1 Tax=Albugo laibachii Nc14 TaxID=890382 RepID=F0X2W2_9STRA|nr:AlNc14C2033G13131 [Albugo laibachii Nc14]|eukprot:CCA28293.1 AlNc14C2033G13131 [Albugo laibachii Nc14]
MRLKMWYTLTSIQRDATAEASKHLFVRGIYQKDLIVTPSHLCCSCMGEKGEKYIRHSHSRLFPHPIPIHKISVQGHPSAKKDGDPSANKFKCFLLGSQHHTIQPFYLPFLLLVSDGQDGRSWM